jgi:hypothetical protein
MGNQKKLSQAKCKSARAALTFGRLSAGIVSLVVCCSLAKAASDADEIVGPMGVLDEDSEAVVSDGEAVTPLDESLIAPCDPFADPSCRAEIELEGGQRYEGRLVDGKPHGFGTLIEANGNRFEGYFERGVKMGQGKMTLSDGHFFEGFWVRDRLNGSVTLVSNQGDRYQGALTGDYKPQGRGMLIYANGDQYNGQFGMGLPQGQGVMVFGRTRGPNAGDRHEGQFDRGLRHGPGRYVFADGTSWQVECQYDRCERAGFVGMITGRQGPQQGPSPERERRMTDAYRRR